MAADDAGYIPDNLMPGERLVRVARVHPLVPLPPAVIAGIGAFFGVIGFAIGLPALGVIGVLVALIAGLVALAWWVEQKTTEFGCTDRRIVIKSGLLTTSVREMPLAKVETLRIERSLFGKLLGYGTLVFKGSGGTRRTCRCIEEPSEFYRQVQEQVARAQGTQNRGRAEPGAAADGGA